MMDDYFDKFYNKLSSRHALLIADNYKAARSIAAWKENMASHWDEIEVVSVSAGDLIMHQPRVGESYKIEVVIDTHALNDKGLGIDLVAVRTSQHNNNKLYDVRPLELVGTEGSRMTFAIEYRLDYAGAMKFGLRMYPKNDLLPHRMDFCYVRWIG